MYVGPRDSVIWAMTQAGRTEKEFAVCRQGQGGIKKRRWQGIYRRKKWPKLLLIPCFCFLFRSFVLQSPFFPSPTKYRAPSYTGVHAPCQLLRAPDRSITSLPYQTNTPSLCYNPIFVHTHTHTHTTVVVKDHRTLKRCGSTGFKATVCISATKRTPNPRLNRSRRPRRCGHFDYTCSPLPPRLYRQIVRRVGSWRPGRSPIRPERRMGSLGCSVQLGSRLGLTATADSWLVCVRRCLSPCQEQRAKHYFSVFRQVNLQCLGIVFEAQGSHGEQDVFAVDRLPLLLVTFL